MNKLNFDHLIAMCDSRGLFEHSEYDKPRREHGYCVDDVARSLILLERVKSSDPHMREMVQIHFAFLLSAQLADGHFLNRCDERGIWLTPGEMGDHWGRALWALGTTAAREMDGAIAEVALEQFVHSSHHQSHHLRPMIFASLGAAEILRLDPRHAPALNLLRKAADSIPDQIDKEWPWPEPRLSYANAVIPELLILAGHYLENEELFYRGIFLLEWLINIERVGKHFSVTPTGGWKRGEARPGFDQQPIEVAALVDACATAFELTGDPKWLREIQRGADWFEGHNDGQIWMYDPDSGAGFDGLMADGHNKNRGAESTLSYLLVADRQARLLSVMA